MKLLEKGGDLNVLNKSRNTPIAYGTQEFLTQLNLIAGVSYCEKNQEVFF